MEREIGTRKWNEKKKEREKEKQTFNTHKKKDNKKNREKIELKKIENREREGKIQCKNGRLESDRHLTHTKRKMIIKPRENID